MMMTISIPIFPVAILEHVDDGGRLIHSIIVP